jgi:hypothetical protein
MSLLIGPVGAISRGCVLDVNKKHLERKLKEYDPQLYIKWNPRKLSGNGVWEIRRRPEKSCVFVAEFDGHKYYSFEAVENDLESHILDVGSLNYEILTKIKKMDTWALTNSEKGGTRVSQWIDGFERKEAQMSADANQKIYDDMLYDMKQNRRALNEYRETILRGEDPNNLAKFWK